MGNGECGSEDAAGSRVYFLILAAFSIAGAKFGSFVRVGRLFVSGNIEFLMMGVGQKLGNFGRAAFTTGDMGGHGAGKRKTVEHERTEGREDGSGGLNSDG